MRSGVLLVALSCRKDAPAPPVRADATIAVRVIDAAPLDPCKAAIAEVAVGNEAYAAQVANLGFTTEPLRVLPTGTEIAARGARGAAEAEMARAARARKPFLHRKSGDLVTYTLEGTKYRGLYLGADRQGVFTLGRKGGQIFVLVPSRIHVATCNDPEQFRSACGTPATETVLEIPAGTTFGGFVTIEHERFQLDSTAGKQSACPP